MSASAAREVHHTIVFDRTLDSGGALRAIHALERSPAESRIVLDFGKVRDIDYFALATLAVALAAQPPGRVRVRGLCEQHARLTRYLGIDLDRILGPGHVERRDGDAPEEIGPSAAAIAAVPSSPPGESRPT